MSRRRMATWLRTKARGLLSSGATPATIRAGLEAAQDVDGIGLAGADHHGDAAELGVGLDPLAEVEATVPGQQEIAEHEIESAAGELLEAALGVRSNRHVAARVLEDQGE